MKWALIGIVALVVLGGVGYAVYTLTDAPEQAQGWWDEKKLDNFEVLAKRELDDYEKKIEGYKATLKQLKIERVKWAGHEDMKDSNFKTQEHGFLTLYGYEHGIEFETERGKALAKAYSEAASRDDAVIDVDTGDLDPTWEISVALPTRDGRTDSRDLPIGDILTYLDQIEERLTDYESNVEVLREHVVEIDASITEWEEHIAYAEKELVDLRKEVSKISSQIKLQKAKEDLNELNKSIREGKGDSTLGKLIHGYEKRKSDFRAEAIVEAEGKASSGKVASLDDLDKPAPKSTSSKPRSRFLD